MPSQVQPHARLALPALEQWKAENRSFLIQAKNQASQPIVNEVEQLFERSDLCTYCVPPLKKGDLDRAVSDYDRAIELDPDYAPAYSNRGIAYCKKGALDQVISDFDQAIGLDPDHARAYFGRGLAYTNKGDLNRAIFDLHEVLRLSNSPEMRQIARDLLQTHGVGP